MPYPHNIGLRIIATVTTLSLMQPTVAHAGPDDGRIVITGRHVDSPRATFDGGTFDLKAPINREEVRNLDDVVLYIPKGWDRLSQETKYQYTFPHDIAIENFATPGETYYAAPATTAGNKPILWGYGVDVGGENGQPAKHAPIEDYRDNIIALDFVKAEGPGRVEVFNYTAEDGWYSLNRHMGSGANSPRFVTLGAAAHSHPMTTFSKPGRYRLSYRTIARSHDGTLVESPVLTQSVQVGGMKPLVEATPPVSQRYQEAFAGDVKAANYSFGIQPKTPDDDPQDGDEFLETMNFHADSPDVTGTLTVLIDGHFLTDLPVENGEATWDEHLGPEASKIQAIFTPTNDQTGVRWLAPALDWSEGTTTSVNSTAGEGTLLTPSTPAGNTEYLPGDYTPKPGTTISTKIEPVAVSPELRDTVGEDFRQFKLTVTVDDPNYQGFIVGGVGEDLLGNVNTLDVSFESAITNGVGEYYFDGHEVDGEKVGFAVVPHPTINAEKTTVLADAPFNSDGETTFPTVPLNGVPTPTPTPDPTPITTPQLEPTPPPATTNVCTDKYLLETGHVDLLAEPDGDADFHIALADDTLTYTRQPARRNVNDVVLGVRDFAKRNRTTHQADPSLDFLGPVGSTYYALPNVQQANLIWPGYNTQAVDYSRLKDGVQLYLEPANIPEGASFGLYQPTNIRNKYTIAANSLTKDYVVDTAISAHVHTNWAFSKPGTYVFNTYYTAETIDGEAITSPKTTLQFVVGNDELKNCRTTAKPTQASQPEPAPTTSAAPQPTPSTTVALSTSVTTPPRTATPKPVASTSTTPVPQPPAKHQGSNYLQVLTVLGIIGGVIALLFSPLVAQWLRDLPRP